jgi:hypothetical protein
MKKLASLGRNFITINENLEPLDPTNGFPSLALESELSINYFNNFIRTMVFRRGVAYKSYGNEFVQTDIAGINVSDRIRLFDNRVLASASYETKWNNTQNDAENPTTTFNTLNTSVTVHPGAKFPSLTIGYGQLTRKNDILSTETDSVKLRGIADELTNRYFFAVNYEFRLAVRNALTASVSIANKQDNTYYLRNQDNVNVSTALTTFYKIPLQTTLALIVSQNKTYQAIKDTLGRYLSQTIESPFSYSTISLNARYRMMKDRLNLLATIAPSFGDFKRMLIQAGADYQIFEGHYIVGQLDFINNPGKGNDIIASIVYRFTF